MAEKEIYINKAKLRNVIKRNLGEFMDKRKRSTINNITSALVSAISMSSILDEKFIEGKQMATRKKSWKKLAEEAEVRCDITLVELQKLKTKHKVLLAEYEKLKRELNKDAGE